MKEAVSMMLPQIDFSQWVNSIEVNYSSEKLRTKMTINWKWTSNFKVNQPTNKFLIFDSDDFSIWFMLYLPGKGKAYSIYAIKMIIVICGWGQVHVSEMCMLVFMHLYWPLHDYHLTEIHISVICSLMLIQCKMKRSWLPNQNRINLQCLNLNGIWERNAENLRWKIPFEKVKFFSCSFPFKIKIQ